MATETQVQKIMRLLNISEKEALEVIAFDKQVDKMRDSEVNADLTLDQKQASKKARQADRKVTDKKQTAFKFENKPKKENPTKAGIITEIAKFLAENSVFAIENLEITNKERVIDFRIGEFTYSITLTQHRKKN